MRNTLIKIQIAMKVEEKTQTPDEPKTEMSFLDHLEELRRRLFRSLIAVFILALGAFYFSEHIINFLARPLPKPELIFLAPTDAFLIRFKAAIAVGIMAGLPYLFFQFWKFVAPGLYKTEKKYLLGFVFFATVFFFLGVVFAFYILLPLGIKFLLQYGTAVMRASLAANEYFGFILKMFLAFGLVFELPLLSFFLTKIGLLNYKFLQKSRRYSYVLIFIVAAILTPPDVFSQCVMALPLIVLYEISIWVSRFSGKKDDKS